MIINVFLINYLNKNLIYNDQYSRHNLNDPEDFIIHKLI